MEPATPYVRGKYYFFRSRLDDARWGVRVDPADQPLLLPVPLLRRHDPVKKGDLAGATQGYDALLQDAGARRARARTSRT